MQRLEGEIKPAADRIMNVLLQILSSVGSKSSVPDTVFAAVGALSNALEEDFAKYMNSFSPFLYNALGNREEPGLCAMAIGLVSDITRALGQLSQPYCDTFMNYLLQNLSVSDQKACEDYSIDPWVGQDCQQSIQASYPPNIWGYCSGYRAAL